MAQVRTNLHVVICFSPVGPDFGTYAKRFPALVNCFAEDHEVLTNYGFMSLDDVLKWPKSKPSLLFASYDEDAEMIVYERPMRAPIVNKAATQEMIEFTPHNDASNWTQDFDLYGRRKQPAVALGNRVSLMVTPNHDMFCKYGKVHPRRDVFNSTCLNDESGNEQWAVDAFEKRHAGEFHKANRPDECVKFLTYAREGQDIPMESQKAKEVSAVFQNLGIASIGQRLAFLNLYGFWLGGGSLAFSWDAAKRQRKPYAVLYSNEVDEEFLEQNLKALKNTKVKWSKKDHDKRPMFRIAVKDGRWLKLFFTEYASKYKSFEGLYDYDEAKEEYSVIRDIGLDPPGGSSVDNFPRYHREPDGRCTITHDTVARASLVSAFQEAPPLASLLKVKQDQSPYSWRKCGGETDEFADVFLAELLGEGPFSSHYSALHRVCGRQSQGPSMGEIEEKAVATETVALRGIKDAVSAKLTALHIQPPYPLQIGVAVGALYRNIKLCRGIDQCDFKVVKDALGGDFQHPQKVCNFKYNDASQFLSRASTLGESFYRAEETPSPNSTPTTHNPPLSLVSSYRRFPLPCPPPELATPSAKWLFWWAFHLDKDSSRAIVQGWQVATGNYEQKEPRIWTTSGRSRDELVRLLLHGGYAPHFNKIAYTASFTAPLS